LNQVRAEIRDVGSKATLAAFPLATKMMPETALIVGELYRRNNEWKFRAVGQGFVGGLGPLARQYGVDVADDPDVAEAAPPAATRCASARRLLRAAATTCPTNRSGWKKLPWRRRAQYFAGEERRRDSRNW
jgi:hypothetical protein